MIGLSIGMLVLIQNIIKIFIKILKNIVFFCFWSVRIKLDLYQLFVHFAALQSLANRVRPNIYFNKIFVFAVIIQNLHLLLFSTPFLTPPLLLIMFCPFLNFLTLIFLPFVQILYILTFCSWK